MAATPPRERAADVVATESVLPEKRTLALLGGGLLAVLMIAKRQRHHQG